MPVGAAIGGAAVIGGAATAYAGSKAAGAAKDGARAAADASDRATQLQVGEASRQYDLTRGDYAPFREAGYGALNKLQAMYGITPQTANGSTISTASSIPWGGAPAASSGASPGGAYTPTGTPRMAGGYDSGYMAPSFQPTGASLPGGAYQQIAEKAPGGVDWAAYVKGNPDAAAQWSNQTPDLAPFNGDITKYGAFHYENDGARRDLSSYKNAPATPDSGTGTATTAGIPGPDYSDIGTHPDYSSIGNGPDYSKFEESPGYQFRLQRGLDAVKANASARGLLRSTATMKNLDRFAEGSAAQEYDAFYNRKTAAYDARYNRITSAFDADYNRRTSAYDAYANRLAAMAGVGQTATGQTATAGSQTSQTIAGAYGANGANQANAAMAAGNASASAYENIGSGINNTVTGLAGAYLKTQQTGWGASPRWSY